MSGYNDSVKEKIVSFSRKIKEMNPIFTTMDFELLLPLVTEETLVYADPPYLITLGSYNDGKRGFNGWSKTDEIRLLNFLTQCFESGAKVVISNIINYKGLTNTLLESWLIEHKAHVVNVNVRGRNEILAIL